MVGQLRIGMPSSGENCILHSKYEHYFLNNFYQRKNRNVDGQHRIISLINDDQYGGNWFDTESSLIYSLKQ